MWWTRVAAGLVWLSACTSAPPVGDAPWITVSTVPAPEAFTLGPSDLLDVVVLGHPELSSAPDGALIDPQGRLFLPLVGALDVRGLTLAQLNDALHAAYGEYMHEPLVTATIRSHASRTFHVMGNVDQPGVKLLDRPLSALEALAQGGRFTVGADRASVFLLRPHGDLLEVHEFDGRTPDARGLVQVRPGDILYVRQKGTQDLQEDLVPITSAFGLNAWAFTTLVD